MEVKIYEKPWVKDEGADERKLYKRLRKPFHFDATVAEAKAEAKASREAYKAMGRKPPGIGVRILTVPETMLARFKQANPQFVDEENGNLNAKGICFAWHNWSDFLCVDMRCPTCGRK